MPAMRRAIMLLASAASMAAAGTASAQSGYLSAAVAADVVRSSRSDASAASVSGDGEALSFALRGGTALGSRWGVELEFARPAEITTRFDTPIRILAVTASGEVAGTGPQLAGDMPTVYFPAVVTSMRQRNTTLATALWARQELSPHVSLAYLGGASFRRATTEIDYAYGPVPLSPPLADPRALALPAATALVLIPRSYRTVAYGVGPMAGLEARVGLTDHVFVAPGLRLHAIESGWLMRPAVGIGWNF